MSDIPIPAAEDAEARRNALILAAASAVNGAVPPIAISLGGLAGLYLLGAGTGLATLPFSFYVVGGAAAAFPAAVLMSRIGRRGGFLVGTLLGAIGGLIAGVALLIGSFIALLAGFAFIGCANAFVQQYRFAAADSGSATMRTKAISWVLAGGVAAAIVGPQAVILTRHLFDPIPFVGGFFAVCGLAVIGALVLLPLSGASRNPPKAAVAGAGGRPLSVIIRQPRFIVSLVCAIGAFSLMSLVMTAAPLAMVACGLGTENATLGIQWHFLAMYAPSFFTGSLMARFGKEVVVAAGLALIAACAVLALLGIDVLHFWGALILVGVGWNFGFIGATAMLTDTYRPEERAKVQGFNDFLLFSVVAVASFSSGSLFSAFGWQAINVAVFPIVVVCLAALLAGMAARRARAAAA